MKSVIKRINIDVIEYQHSYVAAAYDMQAETFDTFIDTIVFWMGIKGYELYDNYDSNRKNSNSTYMRFVKITDSVKITIIINVKISDHPQPSYKGKTGKKRWTEHNLEVAKQLAQEYELDEVPQVVNVSIIFDDAHYLGYEEALQAFKHKIDTNFGIQEGARK